MTAYYNENDPSAAAWLRELIAANLIAPGDVDERSILDVRPIDLRPYTQCHFFAGIGGWSLALRSKNVPDHRPLWTGSCPCQPFSAAGKRRGFDDERHLWPFWRYLIAQCRPPVVFGEQVASAVDWLRLVRSDLEALDYAVGAMPVEAASAGADHLRDRFWFVADDGSGRCARPRGRRVQQSRRTEAERTGSLDLADDDDTRLQGRGVLPERADQRIAGADGVADANESQRWIGNEQSAGQQSQHEPAAETRAMGHSSSTGSGRNGRTVFGAQGEGAGERREAGCLADQPESASFEWIIGADGKARRTLAGLRLLADGFPHRMGLLRGFGNAIDPRPAGEFIAAALESIND